ncbi:MAG TPA: neuraminidase-like domain-containing protein [Acidimicrobiales bacterium]|nr:neuraminidase-like domain-containing protein [Acidimicrobiales bacterium]
MTIAISDGGSLASSAAAVVDPVTVTYVVTGAVSSPTSVAVEGLSLQLVDQNVGGDVVLVSGQTNGQGQFTLEAPISSATLAARHKTSPDLQVQVLLDGAVAASSAVQYNASTPIVLDVVLPSSFPLPSEYEALTGTLASLYPGSLAQLQESAGSQDITYLANKSGWDARAVAMASLAAQFSQAADAVLAPAPATTAAPPPTTTTVASLPVTTAVGSLPATTTVPSSPVSTTPEQEGPVTATEAGGAVESGNLPEKAGATAASPALVISPNPLVLPVKPVETAAPVQEPVKAVTVPVEPATEPPAPVTAAPVTTAAPVDVGTGSTTAVGTTTTAGPPTSAPPPTTGNGSAPTIDPGCFYALFRAGLPTTPGALYRVDPDQVENIWQQAADQGVIPSSLGEQSSTSREGFLKVAAASVLDAAPVVGPSTLRQMLQVVLGNDTTRQQTFANLLVNNPHDTTALWVQVEQSLGTTVSSQLQLLGQMAFLTANNAPLLAALYQAQHNNLTAPIDLVTSGYYQTSAWEPLLANVNPPAEIAGANAAEQKANYADFLAAQVRMSFPTATVAQLANSGSLGKAVLSAGAGTFLMAHQADFDIGDEPISQFLARTGTSASAELVQEIGSIQRVYQITPDTTSMGALLTAGLTSAYAITKLGQASFVNAYSQSLGGTDVATSVFTRAQSITAATTHVALSFLSAKQAPVLGTGALSSIVNSFPGTTSTGQPGAAAQATLEDLFGDLDYCQGCDCQSITSAAAYLVDLLDYIDNTAPTTGFQNPLSVLLSRRPDIGTLPLTCDNTNIALPYIDLVNETLEYFVGNAAPNSESLANFQGYNDDGTISSAELIASPQNDDNTVAQNAYSVLKSLWFPPPLPFYRDLELLRQYVGYFQISLYNLMEALRTTESLETPDAANPSAYGWRDILSERLGLSRLEYRLLTDSTLSLAQIYGFASTTPASSVISTISSLQEFSRRTGVAYADLVCILQTQFINPGSTLIQLLEALALPFSTLEALHGGALTAAQFEAQLPAGLDMTDYGTEGPAAWVTANYTELAGLIVIDVAGAPCDTSKMTLQYLNGSALAQADCVRLLRFIRLWQKLGLSIQQTDALISALNGNSSSGTALQQLDADFLLLLPRIGLAYLAIDTLGLDPPSDLPSLLTCWSPISSNGANSLYAQMFLNPTVLAIDPVFSPDVHGELFTGTPAPLLFAHQTAICAALNLTSAEFNLITGAPQSTNPSLGLGYTATTPLSLGALTAIFQRAWLARTLQMSVLELLSLISATGVDPFNLPVLSDTAPVSSPLLDFVQRAQSMSTAGLAPVQALYLLWGIDLSGVSDPPESVVTGLASALRAAFVAIDSQFTVTGPVTADAAETLMSQVLGPPAANTFFGLLNQTFMTSTPFGYTASTLPAAVVTAANGRLSYDDLNKVLSFAGYLGPTTFSALQAAATGNTTLLAGLTALQTANTQAVDSFFATYDDPPLNLQSLFNTYLAATDPAVALTNLLNSLLPVLGSLRKQEQALAGATTAAGCDPSFAPALLDVAAVMPATSPAAAGEAAVADLTGIGDGGLSVEYFLTDNVSAAPDQSIAAVPSLTYGPANPLPAPGPGATSIAARWSGYISANQDGDYNLSFTAGAGATVELAVGGQTVTMTQSGTTWSNQSAISLQANALTPVQIIATGLTTAFSASWESLGTGWQPIPAANLYSDVLVGYMRTSFLRFLKATALAGDLSLVAAETAYLATRPSLTVAGQAWLGALPVDAPAPSANYAAISAVLDALLAFSSLKTAYPAPNSQTPGLLQALQDIATTPATGTAELMTLTGWDSASLQALLPRLFSGATGLASLPNLLGSLPRLQAAFTIVSATHLSAATLIEAATNDPTPPANPGSTVVADFQSALRSRYAESDWLTVVQPINDSVREMQRDALVAYVLVQSGPAILGALGIATTPNRVPTADDLYNYFLLDVEMEPCMQTSRVRLALSAIQLFIERCLRNLEPAVNPADIDATQWDWRKRYRVWQANREVFLWPENWLDESLRDDQSPFFQTTMKQLLQSDITDDDAVSAYLDYLSNLELVAKLDPCGLWYQPPPAGSADDLAHVIARTGGAHRKYYYRRLQGGGWTAWEEVNLPIEDNPVVPYVWNGRLLLFWLQVHHQPVTSAASSGNLPQDSTPIANASLTTVSNAIASSSPGLASEQVAVVLNFSEYYNGQWQPVKTSDVSNPLVLSQFAPGQFDRSSLFIRPWSAANPADESLYVQVTNEVFPTDVWGTSDSSSFLGGTSWGDVSGFVLHNTHSAPVRWGDIPPVPLMVPTNVNFFTSQAGTGGQQLWGVYGSNGGDNDPSGWAYLGGLNQLEILAGPLPQSVELAQADVGNQWAMPFFFGDAKRVFYVTQSQETQYFHNYSGFGVSSVLVDGTAVNLPSTVLAQPAALAPSVSPGDPVISTSAAQSVINSGTLRLAIGGGTSVDFQGKPIAITGSVPTALLSVAKPVEEL